MSWLDFAPTVKFAAYSVEEHCTLYSLIGHVAADREDNESTVCEETVLVAQISGFCQRLPRKERMRGIAACILLYFLFFQPLA